MKTTLEKKIAEFADLVNVALQNYLLEIKSPEGQLINAMRYSALAPGKRLRPVLMMLVNEIFGGNIMKVLPYACAIEMIHNFTLIHDDLPAIDNDDYRRGLPTNHKVYGESTAILAGDALLNKAYEIIAQSMLNFDDLENKVRVLEVISDASGAEGVIGGEFIDIECENKEVKKDIIKYMYLKKTATLLKASAEVGAIMADANQEEKECITKYALNLGLAFQIKDDILGEIGDSKKIGKPTGRDTKLKKATYLNKFGMEEANILLKSTTEEAIKSLKPLGIKADILVDFATFLLNREK